jgi:hypothetical protein
MSTGDENTVYNLPVPILSQCLDTYKSLKICNICSIVCYVHTEREQVPILPAGKDSNKPPTVCTEDELLEQRSQSKSKMDKRRTERQQLERRVVWCCSQSYCSETDMLTITYTSEPGKPYREELLPLNSNKKLKLLWSPL